MAEIEIKPVDASPAAPDRLLLVSDNLPEPDLLILAALPNVTVVKVLYEKWNLAQLKQAVDAYAYGAVVECAGARPTVCTRARPAEASK